MLVDARENAKYRGTARCANRSLRAAIQVRRQKFIAKRKMLKGCGKYENSIAIVKEELMASCGAMKKKLVVLESSQEHRSADRKR